MSKYTLLIILNILLFISSLCLSSQINKNSKRIDALGHLLNEFNEQQIKNKMQLTKAGSGTPVDSLITQHPESVFANWFNAGLCY